LTIFGGLYVYQFLLLNPEGLYADLHAHLIPYEFGLSQAHLAVPQAYTTPLSIYLEYLGPKFFKTILDRDHLIRNGPTFIVLMGWAGSLIEGTANRRQILGLALGAALVPLALHAVAWDIGRIWAYPLGAALFIVWGLVEVSPPVARPRRESARFHVICVMAILINIFARNELMDGRVERFTFEQRALLYLPVLAVVGWLFIGVQESPGADEAGGTESDVPNHAE
jgi:hypothetical protein